MPKKFYIADWHYGHGHILAFDNRPFKTVEEMNTALIERWNRVVSSGDIVYVVGDMFWCKSSTAIPILQSLNGEKFLIKGNHDRSPGGTGKVSPSGRDRDGSGRPAEGRRRLYRGHVSFRRAGRSCHE